MLNSSLWLSTQFAILRDVPYLFPSVEQMQPSRRLFTFLVRMIGAFGISICLGALLPEILGFGSAGIGAYQWVAIGLGTALFVLSLVASILKRSGAERHATNVVVLAMVMASTCVGVLGICSAILVRNRLAESVRYKKLLAFQSLCELDPDLGYHYKPNLNVRLPKDLQWLDSDVEGIDIEPITTDQFGFDNHRLALESQTDLVDVIGIGDSFMDGASHPLYEYFRTRGTSFHSYAMPRYCPPQYNFALEHYALPRQPDHIIYGIYVNDFAETIDFERWKESGLDWYEYHGGTIAGNATDRTGSDDQLQLARVCHYVKDANDSCTRHDVRMSLLLIPDKDFVLTGTPTSATTSLLDGLAEFARAQNIRTVDLRSTFKNHPNPAELYWKQDGHWSVTGIVVAAKQWQLDVSPE